MERLVACCGKDLCFSSRPLDNPELLAYAREYGSLVPDGGELEACLAIPAWLRKIADVLSDGYLLVIDYGYSDRELTAIPGGDAAFLSEASRRFQPTRRIRGRKISRRM